MITEEFRKLLHQGMNAMEEGNTLMALLFFQDAAVLSKTPAVLSCLGYCLATEHGQMQKGISLCLEAVQKDPQNALHYWNLGRIYLLTKRKRLALQTFRNGLKFERHQRIIDELRKLGVRRQPVLASLPRENPLNRFLGVVFSRLGLR